MSDAYDYPDADAIPQVKPKAPHALTREQVDKWIEHLRIVVPQRFHANPDGSLGPNTMTALDALSWREWEFIAWLFNDYAAQRQALAQQAQRIQELEEQRVKYGPICLNCGKDKPCMTEAEASQHGGSTPCTFDPAPKELWQRCKQLQATLAERKNEIEQVRVQLAGCLTAAEGATTEVAKKGDYGWSVAYQETLNLRISYDLARQDAARLREALKFYADPHSYGLNGGSNERIIKDHGQQAQRALKEA